MPANLNALIRYKTINSCLFGGKRRWSIQELIDACSEALADTRGRYKPISERTVRDDLRVLRSDLLGFNAPIEQEKSLYFYSDPQFSILSLKITDAGIADRIYGFLIGIRTEIQHPELESILEQLCRITNKTYEKPVSKEGIKKDRGDKIMFNLGEGTSESSKMVDFKPPYRKTISSWMSNILLDPQSPKKIEFSWGDVFAKTI